MRYERSLPLRNSQTCTFRHCVRKNSATVTLTSNFDRILLSKGDAKIACKGLSTRLPGTPFRVQIVEDVTQIEAAFQYSIQRGWTTGDTNKQRSGS